jgi:hypothetical protein
MAKLNRNKDLSQTTRKVKFPTDIRYLLILNIILNLAILYFVKFS